MHTEPILVALGANLPDAAGRSPLETCRWAAAALDALLPGVRLVALSRWWLTAPMPPSAQPDYVNGVARLAGRSAPDTLLAALLRLEEEAGRRRSGERYAARPLDLDLLAMGELVREAPDPVLPHARMHLRRFVLAPLAEVAPGWIHPVLRRPVEALLAALPEQEVRPLGCSPADRACEG